MKQMNTREQGYTIISILIILILTACSLSAAVQRVGHIQYKQVGSKDYSKEVITDVTFTSGYELNHQHHIRKYKANRIYVIIHWISTNKSSIALVDGYVSPYPFIVEYSYLLPYKYFIANDRIGNRWLIDTN